MVLDPWCHKPHVVGWTSTMWSKPRSFPDQAPWCTLSQTAALTTLTVNYNYTALKSEICLYKQRLTLIVFWLLSFVSLPTIPGYANYCVTAYLCQLLCHCLPVLDTVLLPTCANKYYCLPVPTTVSLPTCTRYCVTVHLCQPLCHSLPVLDTVLLCTCANHCVTAYLCYILCYYLPVPTSITAYLC